MEKRTKLGLLILLALAVLAFGIWYLFQPIIKQVQQPPTLPNEVTPSKDLPASSTQQIPVGSGGTVVPQDVKQLQDLAKSFIARSGSGSSSDGFSGYDDVALSATLTERAALEKEQSDLQAAHPASGPLYGITTRVVSVTTVSGESGAAQMSFNLQTQRVEDAGNPSKPTSVTYKQATVTFERQPDGTYLVSNVVWTDIVR